jgi:hypothetical protein
MIHSSFARYTQYNPLVAIWCVTFNGFVDGTRRVFVADMKELIS